MKLSQTDGESLNFVAQSLKIPVDWLIASINFETNGTWDTKIKNPLSSARGLIQFTNTAAVGLGYKDSLDLVTKHPSISSQLRGPVLKYLQQFAPYQNKQDFIFGIFLPKYRKSPSDTVIYSDNLSKQNEFRRANPGIITVGDYFQKLERDYAKTDWKITEKVLAGLAGMFFLGALAWVFFFHEPERA